MSALTRARALPGTRIRCQTCGGTIVFARTMASPTGTGGKSMPLDVAPDDTGNVAVHLVGRQLVCRVLGKDDGIDTAVEVLAMPHWATCEARAAAAAAATLADDDDQPDAEPEGGGARVLDLTEARRRRRPQHPSVRGRR